MKTILTIDCKNSAFTEFDDPSMEVSRILRDLADRIEGHPNFSEGHSQPVRDINGNQVGHFDIVEDFKLSFIYAKRGTL